MLTPQAILERLPRRFDLLSGVRRDASARQATLRGAIDWSWQLLAPWEQAALAQCSVFRGGFTLAAAEEVIDLADWADAPWTMDVIQALHDKSVLRSWESETGSHTVRFHFYESIRQFAGEQLMTLGPGAAEGAIARHGEHYRRFGTEAHTRTLDTHAGTEGRDALRLDLENLVAAAERAIARGDGPTAIDASMAAAEVLRFRGPLAVARRLADTLPMDGTGLPLATEDLVRAHRLKGAVLRLSGDAEAARTHQATALDLAREHGLPEADLRCNLGVVELNLGQVSAAHDHFEAALGLYRRDADVGGEGLALRCLGSLLAQQGHTEEALTLYGHALELLQSVGNRRAEAELLGNMASLHRARGDLGDARALHQDALLLHGLLGHKRGQGIVLTNLGNLEAQQGHLAEARHHYRAALDIHRQVGNRRAEGVVLGALGALLHQEGDFDEANTTLLEALTLHQQTGNRRFEGSVLGDLAQVQLAEEDLERSLHFIQEALAIHREVQDRTSEGIALGVLAAIHMAFGEHQTARACLEEGADILRDVGNQGELASLLCRAAELEVLSGDSGAAAVTLDEARALAGDLDLQTRAPLAQQLLQLEAVLGS